jgi:hypothetical protein
MEEQLVYNAREKVPGQNNLMRINESVGLVLRRLGGIVVNSTYLLSEGKPVEAYGYYKFPKLGIIRTILKSNHSEYTFFVNFLGFEGNKENYYKVRMYIEDTLKKVLN